MFCYKCAAPNNDGVKFCRACGTSLETLALSATTKPVGQKGDRRDGNDQPKTREDWLAKRAKGTAKMVSGAIYAGGSLLLPLLAFLFLHDKGWVLITFLCISWVVVSGFVSLAAGISAVMESNTMLRGLDAGTRTSSSDMPPALPARGNVIYRDHNPGGIPKPTNVSVTESTTQLLDEPNP
jgi:hypothetical protein